MVHIVILVVVLVVIYIVVLVMIYIAGGSYSSGTSVARNYSLLLSGNCVCPREGWKQSKLMMHVRTCIPTEHAPY